MQVFRTIWALPLFVIAGLGGQAAAQQSVGVVKELPQVVVSASRVPVPTDEVGSAITVIDEEDLERRQIRVVSDVLRDVPGVAVSRSGPAGSITQIRLRGAESNQTLVLVDGIEVNNPASFSEFDFGNLLNAEISRIEVLRGPQSALFGSDALGGVVNIITKRSDYGDGAGVFAQVQGGSMRSLDQLYRIGYGGDYFYVTGTYNRFQTDGVSVANIDNGNPERDGFRNEMARLQVGVMPFEFLEIDLVGIFSDSYLDLDFGFPLPADSFDRSEVQQRFGRAQVKATLLDGHMENIASASFGDSESNFKDPTGAQSFFSDGEKTKFNFQTNIFVSTPQFVDAEHSLSLMVEHENERQFTIAPAFGAPGKIDEITNIGYAAEYRLALMESLFLSFGARFDDNDALFRDAFTSRITAAYLIDGTDTRIHASYGKGVKNPTLFELFGSTLNFTGNPNLTAERSKGLDFGVEQSLLDGKIIADVTWFSNRISGLVTGSGMSVANLPGTTRIDGIEATVSAEPLAGLALELGYTFTNGTDPMGARLIRRPRHIASANASYSRDVIGRPVNLNANVRYNGHQRDSFGAVTADLDDYILLGIAATVELYDGFEVFSRGENLLNDQHPDVFGFGTAGISGFAGMRYNIGR